MDSKQNVTAILVSQQVNQAMGIAIQDSVTHLQQMMALNTAVCAKSAEIALASDADVDKMSQISKAQEISSKALEKAIKTLSDIGNISKEILNDCSALLDRENT